MVLEFLPCLLLIFFLSLHVFCIFVFFSFFLHFVPLLLLFLFSSVFYFSTLVSYFTILTSETYSFKYSDYSGTNHHCCSIVALSRRLHLLIASVCIKIQCNCFPALNFSSLLFLSSCFKIF